MLVNLKESFQTKISPELVKKFGYENVNMVPKLEKIVINSGVSSKKEREVLQETLKTLTTISGQKPITTKASKAVANFKIREGQAIGAKVTLRNAMMYDFLTRLIHNALPRVRDFRGIKATGFDGFGNYSMGITDQTIFTEIDLDKIKHMIGMNITFVTTARNDEECKALLEMLGLPFAKQGVN
jgi:large subunit ribosomal protein L5